MADATFASSYKDACLSDFDLYLIPESTPAPSDGTAPEVCKGPTPVHGLLLTSRSGYFDASIKGPCSVLIPEVDGRKLLFLQLDPTLWPCMLDHLLYHMYHDSLPEGLLPGQALQLMQLADRLDVPRCTKHCSEYFTTVDSQLISWDDVSSYYSLPASLQERKEFAAAARAFRTKLHGSYNALGKAWGDKKLRATFLKLPLAAVEELAACDELEVVSENVVATALASWVAHSVASRAQHGAALLKHLRLHHLTQAYVADVLTQLPGIGQHVTLDMVLAALQYNKTSEYMRHELELDKTHKPARQETYYHDDITFDWTFDAQEVAKLVAAKLGPEHQDGEVASEVHHYNGFTLQLVVLAASSAAAKKPTLYISVVAGVQLGPGRSIPVSHVVLQGTVQVPTWRTGSCNSFDVGQSIRFVDGGCVYKMFRTFDLGDGCVNSVASLAAAMCSRVRDVAQVSNPASPGQLQQLQKMLLCCTITTCM